VFNKNQFSLRLFSVKGRAYSNAENREEVSVWVSMCVSAKKWNRKWLVKFPSVSHLQADISWVLVKCCSWSTVTAVYCLYLLTVSSFLGGHSDAPVSVPRGVGWCWIRSSCRCLEHSVHGMRFSWLSLGLLRPFVFYNRLAIGQKDRLTGQP